MTNKIDEISNLISLNSYDIIVITESWLNSDVTDNYVSQSGYKTFRRDRSNDQRGGGICTYIRKQLHIVEISDMNDPEVESQWFLIKSDRLPRGINTIILGTIYHPHVMMTNVLELTFLNAWIISSQCIPILVSWF